MSSRLAKTLAEGAVGLIATVNEMLPILGIINTEQTKLVAYLHFVM